MILAFAAMMGWCGTLWPGWWRHPRPVPDPEPWWRIVDGLIGAAGGVIAWLVFAKLAGPDAGLLETAAVSFFGGVFLGSLVGGVGIGARSGVRTG